MTDRSRLWIVSALVLFAAAPLTGCKRRIKHISPDMVFSWKDVCLRYFDKPVLRLTEDFGGPGTILRDSRTEANLIRYSTGIPAREYDFIVRWDTVVGCFIYPREEEFLDVRRLLLKAPMFTFTSGKYDDSVYNYFLAKDNSDNAFQFVIFESSVTFYRFGASRDRYLW